MREKLLEKANKLPMLPGVYIMLNATGQVIYVGKAKKLKNRVTSYFRGSHLPKVEAMVQKVNDFNVIVVNSEFESLILENSLIKQHQPHYNILLKDDKGYPFIRLDKKRRIRDLLSSAALKRTERHTLAHSADERNARHNQRCLKGGGTVNLLKAFSARYWEGQTLPQLPHGQLPRLVQGRAFAGGIPPCC